MIRITYVTITYNAAAVLQRTLDSVLEQDYPEIVHLIVDGASTDGTLDLVNDYITRSNGVDCSNSAGVLSEGHKKGHRIQVISEPDHGIYDAMNKGLRGLDGDYVCFLNAGDFLPARDTVSRIVKQIDTEGALPAVLYGDTDIVDAEGRFLHHRRLAPPENLSWRSFRQGMVVCHQAFYARTDIAKRVDYDLQFRYSADVDWCIRVMKECENDGLELKNLHLTVVNYLQEGQTTLHHRASLRERFRVMVRHYGWLSTLVMHGWFAIRQLYK